MKPPGPVWVDERNPIYRRGLVTCLQAEGYAIAGESALLRPPPDLSGSSLVIFDLDAVGSEVAGALARRGDLLLIGLVRGTPAAQVRELLADGMSAALSLRTLTPSRLLSCIRALVEDIELTRTNGATPGNGTAAAFAPGAGNRDLTRRELDVLSLLADGDSTREIAVQLSYSERTVKNIVHEVRRKLHGRTRAQAVAVAARRGII
jgi:DNA-binding NarL/FixJ family response regulator